MLPAGLQRAPQRLPPPLPFCFRRGGVSQGAYDGCSVVYQRVGFVQLVGRLRPGPPRTAETLLDLVLNLDLLKSEGGFSLFCFSIPVSYFFMKLFCCLSGERKSFIHLSDISEHSCDVITELLLITA